MEEAEESKRGPGGTAENRRKRPPVTIDLEADAVSEVPSESMSVDDDPEVTTPDPVPVDGDPVHPSAEAAPARDPEPESAATIERRRAGAARYVPVIAAALLGGVAGGLIAAFLLAPQTDTVNQAATDSRFATLDARLGQLDSAVKNLPSAAGGSATLDDGRVAALETEIAGLKSALAALPSAPASAAPAPDLAPLEARIATLESRPATAAAPAVDLSPLEGKIGGLQARLDQIEAHPPADPKTETAALTIALTSLRQAATGGGSFASELGAYSALGGKGEALASLAAAGAPSLAALQSAFPPLAAQIRIVSAKADPNASMWQRLAASAGSLVEVKPAGPIEGTSAVAVLSRMESAVAKGDLAIALREAESLDRSAQEVIADWSDGARRRIAIDAALAALPPAGSNG